MPLSHPKRLTPYKRDAVSFWHKMLISNHGILFQEAYSVARQFNLIPPVCEQAEYHYFQRDKVEVQLPELYHKIGQTPSVQQLCLSLFYQFNVHFVSLPCLPLFYSFRCWSDDLVSTCLWINHREVQRRCARVLQSSNEGQFDLTGPPLGFLSLKISLGVILSPISGAQRCEISTVSMLFSIFSS